MTKVSDRHTLPWFAAMSGSATLLASSVSTQLLLSTSTRLDAQSWTVSTQASLQVALALAVFSAAGTVIGWHAGARSPALSPRTAAVLTGVASALFVIVAGVVTAAALMPDVVMVLLTVPIPAAAGGVAAGVSVWHSRQPRESTGMLVVQFAGTGARPGAVRAVRRVDPAAMPVAEEPGDPAPVARLAPRGGGAVAPEAGASLAALAPIEREADRRV